MLNVCPGSPRCLFTGKGVREPLERDAFRGVRGSTMQQRSIVVLLVAAALPAPVRPEPFWQRWQDSVIERLGVNYS